MAKKVGIGRLLGEGSFGSVRLVKLRRFDGTTKFGAMKESSKYEATKREMQVLTKLRGCPRIIQLLTVEDILYEHQPKAKSKTYRIFLEYAPLGTLYDLMNTYENQRIPEFHIREITRNIVEGLVSIHNHNYIHCDLKSENILVFPNAAKISDFGVSREIEEKNDWWNPDSPFLGTPDYMSPESVTEGKIGKALDIWSLGCIVLEMYTGDWPWLDKSKEEIVSAMKNGGAPEIPETLPLLARQFIETCFARNPEERGDALGLLSHSFLRREESKPETKAHDHEQTPLKTSSKPNRYLKVIPPRSFKSKDTPRRPLRLKSTQPKRPTFP